MRGNAQGVTPRAFSIISNGRCTVSNATNPARFDGDGQERGDASRPTPDKFRRRTCTIWINKDTSKLHLNLSSAGLESLCPKPKTLCTTAFLTAAAARDAPRPANLPGLVAFDTSMLRLLDVSFHVKQAKHGTGSSRPSDESKCNEPGVPPGVPPRVPVKSRRPVAPFIPSLRVPLRTSNAARQILSRSGMSSSSSLSSSSP